MLLKTNFKNSPAEICIVKVGFSLQLHEISFFTSPVVFQKLLHRTHKFKTAASLLGGCFCQRFTKENLNLWLLSVALEIKSVYFSIQKDANDFVCFFDWPGQALIQLSNVVKEIQFSWFEKRVIFYFAFNFWNVEVFWKNIKQEIWVYLMHCMVIESVSVFT